MGQLPSKQLDNIASVIKQQFQNLKKFLKSKDRKHPSTFVVFSEDKSNAKAKDAVTKAMYELFLHPTDMSAISYFFQNKTCDLYLICESCNQIQGKEILLL